MKRITVLAVLAVAVGLVALTRTSAAHADQGVSTRVPISSIVFNPCTGTGDFLTGFAHFQTFAHNNSNNNSVHVTSHATVHIQGQVLTLVSQETSILNVDLRNGPNGESVLSIAAKILERGAADNSAVTLFFHMAVNANGDVAVTFQRIEATCRG